MDRTIPLRHLKTVLNQGVGRYLPQLQRLTFQFSKTRMNNKGVRDFLESKSERFCKKHPHVVLYVLPTDAPQSRIIAEYLNGNNLEINPNDFTLKQVEYWVEIFNSKSGQRDFKLTSMHHTEIPSIQGQWTPATYKKQQSLGNKFCKVLDETAGEYKVQIESASEEDASCSSVEDVPATNGLFTRVGAF
ncbi:large ribosomal subunit protein mL43-like [Symsagittifera roscoffensis]|uniref:large ribosomal subunit protein mL43-like n=1 Tax=Symsagittifera roscoffensis TaxID=84072 RepID=UPI00307B590F